MGKRAPPSKINAFFFRNYSPEIISKNTLDEPMLNIGGFDSQTQMNTPLVAHMNVLMEHLKKYRRRGRRVIHIWSTHSQKQNPKNKSLTLISIITVDTIGLLKSRKHLKALFDPGSTQIWIMKSAVPAAANSVAIKETRKINTIAKSMCSEELVRLNSMRVYT